MKLLCAVACLIGFLQQDGSSKSDRPTPDDTKTAKATAKQMFSGPQPGERLPELKVRLLGEKEPKELVASHDGKPIQLMFLHKITRTAFTVIRPLAGFGADQAKPKQLRTILVFLTDDPPAMSKRMQAIAGYLPKDVLVGVSPAGSNGPGPYGLNRNATLTILLAKGGKVSANFALGQPSLQVDGPKIATELAKLLDVKTPNLADFTGNVNRMRMQVDPKLERMLRPLLRVKSDDEAQKQIDEIHEYVGQSKQKKAQLGTSAARLSGTRMVAEASNAKVRKQIAEWAKLIPAARRQGGGNNRDPMIRVLFQPLLARDADEKAVADAAEKILQYVKKNPRTRTQIGEICRNIINANRLKDYGTPKAQESIKRWAKEFTPADRK